MRTKRWTRVKSSDRTVKRILSILQKERIRHRENILQLQNILDQEREQTNTFLKDMSRMLGHVEPRDATLLEPRYPSLYSLHEQAYDTAQYYHVNYIYYCKSYCFERMKIYLLNYFCLTGYFRRFLFHDLFSVGR